MRRSLCFAFCLSLLPVSALLADDPQPDQRDDPVAPPTHVVERTEMVLEIRSDARLEAGEVVRLRMTPEAYSGSFEITAIKRRLGRVSEGDVLLRFDDENLNDQIRSAEISLTEAAERLKFEKQELDIMREANATRIERAEKALADAEIAWELWETFQGERMLRAANLSTQQRESGVVNQREELAQLQSMYEGAELESATKEIVLERAMRSLGIAEQWLDIVREDERITVDYTHGQRARDLRDEVRYREEALSHAHVQTSIAEARKQRTLQQVTRNHEDAVKRLDQLQADKQFLLASAPISGLLSRINLELGERVNSRQVVAEVHDDSTLRLKFNASPNDLRVLREGKAVQVRVPELPEVVMTGKVEAIEPIGRASGQQTHFNVDVIIEQPHPLARIGLNARIESGASLGEVVTVPRKAVTWEDGRAYVDVHEDDENHRREIVIGASSKDAHQVIDGLEPGDVVLLPDED